MGLRRENQPIEKFVLPCAIPCASGSISSNGNLIMLIVKGLELFGDTVIRNDLSSGDFRPAA